MYEQLEALLRSHNARFRVIDHSDAGRSADVAQVRGTDPGQGAKAMLCMERGNPERLILAVLPGNRKLDFRKLAEACGVKKTTLASPDDAMRATGCAIGTIPPFCLKPGIELVAEPSLLEAFDEIAFNACRLDRSMVLNSADYLRIAQPTLHSICA